MHFLEARKINECSYNILYVLLAELHHDMVVAITLGILGWKWDKSVTSNQMFSMLWMVLDCLLTQMTCLRFSHFYPSSLIVTLLISDMHLKLQGIWSTITDMEKISFPCYRSCREYCEEFHLLLSIIIAEDLVQEQLAKTELKPMLT